MKFIILLVLLGSAASAFANPVTLKFTNLGTKGGKIAIAVFKDAASFPDKKPFFSGVYPSTPGTITIDLPPGDYAISSFLDENNNKKLDTNIMGIPKERFGFSNNPKVQFSEPNFSECLITVESREALVTSIRMLKFL